jgi:hypothetical protein
MPHFGDMRRDDTLLARRVQHLTRSIGRMRETTTMTHLEWLGFFAAVSVAAVGCGHAAAQPVNDPGGGSVDKTITEGTGTSKGDTTGSGSSLPNSTVTGNGDVSTGVDPAGAAATGSNTHGAR